MFTNTDEEFIRVVTELIDQGEPVTSRGMRTLEFLSNHTQIDMNHCVLTIPERKLGYRFMAAEAAWILSGDNRVSTIVPYAEAIREFSDDGIRYFGSYGPKIIDQLSYVVDTLARDQGSRQAVMNIWREQPRPTKDVPCTISLQFFIRDGKLHCVDTMRSSDIWLGWPYDIFNMSMISLGIVRMLREIHNIELTLGNLHLNAGSQHLYERNWDEAQALANLYEYVDIDEAIEPGTNKYVGSYDDLVRDLWVIADYSNKDAKAVLIGMLG